LLIFASMCILNPAELYFLTLFLYILFCTFSLYILNVESVRELSTKSHHKCT